MTKAINMQRLPWRSVWVTGAGRGIGAALVQLFCKQGVTVYASSRNVAQLQALKERLSGCTGKMIVAPLDITEPQQIAALLDQWHAEGTFVDLVVLNAGTHDPFSARHFCAERSRQLLQTNLQGTLNCLEPVIRHYVQQNSGHIAVMASVAGYRGLPGAAMYGASKAALINLCEAFYLDLKGTGIKIQLINPGFVRTPLTDKNTFEMPALMEADQAAERIVSGLLSKRFEIVFPRRFVYVLKFLRLLPYRCYFYLVQRITQGKAI